MGEGLRYAADLKAFPDIGQLEFLPVSIDSVLAIGEYEKAGLARPEGFRCPRCKWGKAWAVRATLFQCSNCDYQTSVTAGTVFQDTRKPLCLWFRAMWFVTSQKNGASALGLQRVLGLGSYRTAWSWLHKLRRAMVRPGRDRLTGWVEVWAVRRKVLSAGEFRTRLEL